MGLAALFLGEASENLGEIGFDLRGTVDVFGASDEKDTVFDEEARGTDVAEDLCFAAEFYATSGSDIALDFAFDDDVLGADLSFDDGLIANDEGAVVGFDAAFVAAIDVEFPVKGQAAFELCVSSDNGSLGGGSDGAKGSTRRGGGA